MRHILFLVCFMAICGTVAFEPVRTAEIVNRDGIPRLALNGKEVEPLLLFHTIGSKPWYPKVLPDADPSLKLLELARKHEFHFTTAPVPLIWPDENGKADYAPVRAIVEKLLAADPDALFLPRLIQNVPEWWFRRNPEHYQRFQWGRDALETPASTLWRQDFQEALRRQILEMERLYGDHIPGYHIGFQSCGENFYNRAYDENKPSLVGFSIPFRDEFRRFLQKKYGTVNALNLAWRSEYERFDIIPVPGLEARLPGKLGAFREPGSQRDVIDLAEFMQLNIAEVVVAGAETVKKATGRRKLTVFFYGGTLGLGKYPFGPAQSGSLALRNVLESPAVDILCNPYSYFERQYGGIGQLCAVVDSIALHGKLYLLEDDTRSHAAPYASFGRTADLQESKHVFTRQFARIMAHNLGVWWMDFGTGSNANEDIFRHFAELRRIRREIPAEPYRPEIGIVLDERSSFFLRNSNEISKPSTFLMSREYSRIGTPVGFYLLDDVCAGMIPDSVKFLVFLNAFSVSEQQRAQLHRELTRFDRSALWFYAPGYLDGNGADGKLIAQLTSFGIRQESEMDCRVRLLNPMGHFKAGQMIGIPQKVNPLFSVVQEPGIEVYATYAANGTPAFAARKNTGWNSIFYGGLFLPADLLRAVARRHGVHIYCYSDDAIVGNSRFLAITAQSDGVKKIHFREEMILKEMFTGEEFRTKEKIHFVPMKRGECLMFAIQPVSGRQ